MEVMNKANKTMGMAQQESRIGHVDSDHRQLAVPIIGNQEVSVILPER